jgi:hypothetical protein
VTENRLSDGEKQTDATSVFKKTKDLLSRGRYDIQQNDAQQNDTEK